MDVENRQEENDQMRVEPIMFFKCYTFKQRYRRSDAEIGMRYSRDKDDATTLRFFLGAVHVGEYQIYLHFLLHSAKNCLKALSNVYCKIPIAKISHLFMSSFLRRIALISHYF